MANKESLGTRDQKVLNALIPVFKTAKQKALEREPAKGSIGKAVSTVNGDRTKNPQNANITGTSTAGIASPLTEQARTEVIRTLTSTDGLVEIDVADVSSMSLTDANGAPVVINFLPFS